MTSPVEEIWEQIGTRLRDAREKAEMTVDDVVYRARIPRTVIEALEAEDFSVFTSPTYAKSFLKQYSEFLKVDADPWLNALEPASYVSGESWQPMFASGEVPPRPIRDPRRAEQESAQVSGPGKWSALWLMFLTAALVLAVIGGYQKFEEKFGKEEPTPVVRETPVAVPPEKKIEPTVRTSAVPVEESLTPAEVKNEEERVNPPRAIIVRD